MNTSLKQQKLVRDIEQSLHVPFTGNIGSRADVQKYIELYEEEYKLKQDYYENYL